MDKEFIDDYFIDENKNTYFTQITEFEAKSIMDKINNYYLEYRSTLNLPGVITFGTEIEYEGIKIDIVENFIEENFFDWESTYDGSLSSGGEIKSPIMKDKKKYWKELKIVCDFLKDNKANTCYKAGGHIHIGASLMDKLNYWRTFLKIYTIYESVLFRFFYGDKINARKKINNFASPIADELYKCMGNIIKVENFKELEDYIVYLKTYPAVNFKNVIFDYIWTKRHKNTIEFRSPNATIDEVIWQNNINVIAKMLLVSTQNVIDIDYLDYKLKYEYDNYNEILYNKIDLNKAFEFIDIVFDNNLDKVYFLRQYVKDYQIKYSSDYAIMSKKFTK